MDKVKTGHIVVETAVFAGIIAYLVKQNGHINSLNGRIDELEKNLQIVAKKVAALEDTQTGTIRDISTTVLGLANDIKHVKSKQSNQTRPSFQPQPRRQPQPRQVPQPRRQPQQRQRPKPILKRRVEEIPDESEELFEESDEESEDFMADAYDSSSEEPPAQPSPQRKKKGKRVTIASTPKPSAESMDDIKDMAARMQALAEADD